jgi:hypothetical protein
MSRASSLVLILVIIAGCEARREDDPAEVTGDASAPVVERYAATLFPTTKVLDPSNVEALLAVDEDGTLHLRRDAPLAADLAIDDVILATITPKTPRGLLRRVTGLEEQGETLVVASVPAPLHLAFEHLDLRVVGAVSFADEDTTVPGWEGLETRRQPLGTGPMVVDFWAFNGDGDPATGEDQVRVQGTFEGSFGYDFEMSIDWPHFTTWPPDVTPDLEVSLSATLGAGARLEVSGMASKGFSREETLPTIPLPPFSVGLLTFVPEIAIEVSMEGGAAGAYSLALGAAGAVTAGATVSSDGETSITPPSVSFSFDAPSVVSSWYAQARASAGPVLHLRFYDVVGPYAGLKAFAALDAKQGEDPCWELRGGLEGVIGFDMELGGLELLDWGIPFGIAEETLDTGMCQPDPILDGATDIAPPTFTPWSRIYGDVASTFSAEGSRTGLTRTLDGRYLVSGTGTQGLLKIDREGDVLWAHRYRMDDAVLPVPMAVNLAEDATDTGILATASPPLSLLKLDAAGAPLWARRAVLPFQPTAGFGAMVQAPNGDVILAGAIQVADMGDTDLWVTRLDASGAPVWSRRWGAVDRNEEPTSLLWWGDDLVVVGHTFSVAQEPADQAFALRLSAAGAPMWEREIRGCDLFSDLTLRKALVTRDGDLVAGGRYQFSSPKALLLKLKADGSLSWSGGAAAEFIGVDLNDVVQLTDGGFLATGTWWTAGQDDIWLARTDSIGRFLWLQRYDSGVRDGTPGLALTGEGGVLVAGYSDPDTEALDLWALRVPVEDGALELPQGSSAAVTAMPWSDVEDPCLVDEASALPAPADWPVSWEDVTITASPFTPVQVQLAP